jgi:hypothetical protein
MNLEGGMRSKDSDSDTFECIQCGTIVPLSANVCPACGLEIYPADISEDINKDPAKLDIVSFDKLQESIPYHIDYSFIFKWILANIVGEYVAQIMGVLLFRAFYPQASTYVIATIPIFWAVFGILLGLAQWFVLRDRIPARWWMWILATAVGALVGAILIRILNRSGVMLGIGSLILVGATIGLAQYQILGRRFMGARWWILTVTVGWVVDQELTTVHNLMFDFLSEIAFSVITGFVIAWIIQHPISNIKPPNTSAT